MKTAFLCVSVLALLLAGCGGDASASKQAQPVAVGNGELPPCCEAPVEGEPTTDKSAQADGAAPAPAAPSDGSARVGEWIEPNQRVAFDLDYGATDHDGKSMKLADLLGKPTAMSFIFTNCPNPNMCPLIASVMADLEKKVTDADLADQVHLVMLSYDPVRDTPEALKAYGQQRGVKFTCVKMLRPDRESFSQLLREFQITVGYSGSGEINHAMELLLIDSEGRFVRDYQGGVWDNTAVLADLRRLLDERQGHISPTN